MENQENQEPRNLMDFEAEESIVMGEKVPNGLVLTIEQLKAIKYVALKKDFNDGKGPKTRYKLFIGEKIYFCAPIVLNMFRRAASEPHVLRVRLKIDGTGLATRYDLEKIFDKEAF
jgi:hypothetical protein